MLVDSTKYSRGLVRSLGSMLVTQPPCKVLGIYHSQDSKLDRDFPYWSNSDRTSTVKLLARIRNDKGVRIDQMFAILDEHAATVLESWTSRAEKLANHANDGHWQEDIWHVPGTPRFTLLLDSAAMGDDGLDDYSDAALIKADMDAVDLASRDLATFHQRDWHSVTESWVVTTRILDGHITRHCYLFADAWRKERQREWLPEALIDEPMVSSIRHPINWDT
jgi:hypothetical protein